MKKTTGRILIFVLKTFRREGFFGITSMYTLPQSIEFVLSNAIATKEELRRSEAKKVQTSERSKLSWGIHIYAFIFLCPWPLTLERIGIVQLSPILCLYLKYSDRSLLWTLPLCIFEHSNKWTHWKEFLSSLFGLKTTYLKFYLKLGTFCRHRYRVQWKQIASMTKRAALNIDAFQNWCIFNHRRFLHIQVMLL